MTQYDLIKEWLDGDKNFEKGKKLHFQLSTNYANKLKLAKPFPGQAVFLEMKMRELLKQFEGKKTEVKPEKSDIKRLVHVDDIPKGIDEKLQFEFPKMKPFNELPQILQLLVIERVKLKQNAVKAYAEAQAAQNDVDRKIAMECVCRSMHKNWDIWDEMDEYHRSDKLLGKHELFRKFDFQNEIDQAKLTLSERDFTKLLVKKKTNLLQNIKNQRKSGNIEKMNEYILQFNIVAGELGENFMELEELPVVVENEDLERIESEINNYIDEIKATAPKPIEETTAVETAVEETKTEDAILDERTSEGEE